jgi:hypothetical protein
MGKRLSRRVDSQRIRKRIEEAFGWMKTVGGQGKDQIPGTRSRRMGFHLRGCGLQPDAVAQAPDGSRMSAPASCRLVGRWRIVEADIS